MRNLSATLKITSLSKAENEIIESSRFRNSGVNIRLISAISSPVWLDSVNPIEVFASDSAPALVVIIITTFRKSALRPLLSVKVPWSITCNKMLKISG